jgi:hypothetical protein
MNRKNIQFIDLVNHHGFEIDDFDEIDYKIIEFARSTQCFKRSDIDERFHMSNRNANYRLKKLILKGFLRMDGYGKLARYFFICEK